MKTVVITGSSRGFGFEQAKVFKACGFNVVLSATNEEKLNAAKLALLAIAPGKSDVIAVKCNVTAYEDVENLWKIAKDTFGSVDIWINNAGVNQPSKPVYELRKSDIDYLLEVDLRGTIYGSKIAFAGMKEQGFGQIYNVEGYGSNDAMMTGLTMYGTTKRAVTYFTKSLAKESKDLIGGAVKVCRLTPGIMITDFITHANGEKDKIELPEKTKKVYNILGDYPSTIAEYVVPKMIANTKNDANVVWLTGFKSFSRFMLAGFNKRDFFADNGAKK